MRHRDRGDEPDPTGQWRDEGRGQQGVHTPADPVGRVRGVLPEQPGLYAEGVLERDEVEQAALGRAGQVRPVAGRKQRVGTTGRGRAKLELNSRHRRGLVAGLLARWAEGAAFNTWGVFAITYATATAKVNKVVVLLGVTAGALLMAALTPVAGRLADRFGRRRVFGTGVVGFGLTVVPSLVVVRSGSAALTV